MMRTTSLLIFFSLLLTACAPTPLPSPAPTQPPAAIEPGLSGEAAAATQEPSPSPSPTAPQLPTATLAPAVASPAPRSVAYIGADGNLWLAPLSAGTATLAAAPGRLSADAAAYTSDASASAVTYSSPQWSSDGRYLAYTRQQGDPNGGGYDFTYALILYDAQDGSTRSVLEGRQTAGIAWKPGAHILAYGLAVEPNYFTARGEVDPSLAAGIWALDADSGSTAELVPPSAGYALADPHWAPNARILSFSEILYMEGQGPFAFYDFSSGEYTRWEKPLGGVAWAPDGSAFLHDNLTYAPSFTERIFLTPRDKSGETQLSAEIPGGYSFGPLFSPSGSQIAYLTVKGPDPETGTVLVVQDFPSGQPRELAAFQQLYYLSWTPDGQGLLLSSGDYPNVQVTHVALADGAQTVLADGWQAVMQP